jgi:hypothetical protein
MPKTLNNPKDNHLTLSGLVDLHDYWLDQPVTSNASPNFINLDVNNDVTIGGNLTVSGSTTIIATDVLTIKDNIIEINSEESGVGVSSNLSGIEINRGSLVDYQLVFQETNDTFRIGQVGDLQAVATRQDTPLINGIMIFNNVEQRLDSVNNVPITVTLSSGENSISSTTGALRVSGGLGTSGDFYLDGKIHVKGNTYSNYLDSNSTDELIVNTGSNLLLDVPVGSYAKLPIDVPLSFGGITNKIVSDGTNLLVSTNGFIDLQPGVNQPVNLRTNSPLTFGESTEKINYNGTNIILDATNTFILNTDITVTDSTISSSSIAGSVKLSGGLSISNSQDSTSSSNGGTFTTSGGVGILKKLYVGGRGYYEDLSETNSLNVSGGISISKKIILGSNYSGNPADTDGVFLQIPSYNYTDNATSSSGTVNDIRFNYYGIPTLDASNSSITTSNASTMYIEGSPLQGTNQTITNKYSLFVDSGITRLDGDVQVKSSTYSSDNDTGAIVIEGGVSIKQNLNVKKKLDVSSYTNSSPSSSGVFISLSSSTINDDTSASNAGEMLFNVIAQPTLTSTNVVTTSVSATLVLDGAPLSGTNQTITESYSLLVKDGVLKLESTEQSDSSTTGSLRVDGGVGISNNTDATSSFNGGTFTTAGGVGIAKKLYVAGQSIIENTTESSSSISGSFVTAGGAGILKNLNVGKNTHTGKDNFSGVAETGVGLKSGGNVFTDSSTSGSGVAAIVSFNDFKISTLAATNPNVTTTEAATVYIEGEPIQGTNQTLTDSYSMIVNSGKSRFDGNVIVTDSTLSSSPNNGAFVVNGGIGIGENVNVLGGLDVNGLTTLDQTTIDTGDGAFSVSGGNGVNINVSATSIISNTVGNITLDSESGTLILDGNNGVTVDSTGGISIDAGSSSNINVASGVLDIGAPSINISSFVSALDIIGGSLGGISLNTVDTVNGIKICTANSGIPITIGNTISETIIGDNLVVVGNFTVNGTTTQINSTLISTQDNAVIVNSLPSGLSDGGLLVRRYQTPNNTGAGKVVLDTPYDSSTFQAGSSIVDILVLNSGSSLVNDFYKGWWIKINSGGAVNRTRRIKSYNGSSNTATIYSDSDNDASFSDGLDLGIAPANGDGYGLYPGTYGGMFYDDTNNEWAIGKVPFDVGAGVFPLHGYNDLHCKSLIVEGGIEFGGDSIFDGTLTLDSSSSRVLLARKNGDTGDVFYVDTISSSVNVSNPSSIVLSETPINLKGLDSINSEVLYSQIKSVIESNSTGAVSGSFEINVSRLSTLENYLKLDGNTQSVVFSTAVQGLYVNNTNSSSSSSSGSIIVSGGIGISNVTEAISSNNGGTITTSGGVGIAKKLYVGGGIHIDNVNYAIPSQTTRSIGTKIVLSETLSPSLLDYAIGIEPENMWFTAPSGSTDGFKWYTGDNVENILKLGSSQMNLFISTDSSSHITGSFTTSGGAGIAKKLYVGTDLSVGGNFTSGTWNAEVVETIYGGTGQSNLTSDSVLLGNGTGSIQHPVNLTFSNDVLSSPKLTLSDTTESSSHTSAPVLLFGGLGVAKKAYFGSSIHSVGNLSISGATNANNDITLSSDAVIGMDTSNSSDNGSITIAGGGSPLDTRGGFIRVDGNEGTNGGKIQITAGNNNSSGKISFTTSSVERLSLNYDGTSSFTLVTDSSSSITGAVKIAGGLGIEKKLYVGTDIHVIGNSNLGTVLSGSWNASVVSSEYGGTGASTLTSNAVLLGNGTGTVQSPSTITYTSNTLNLPKLISIDTTQSVSPSTGAVILSGGMGISKNVYTGEGLFVAGNIGIGTTTNVNSALTLDSDSNIGTNTTVSSDNGTLSISGSGVGSSARGALISLAGNQQTNTGLLSLNAGNVSGGEIKMFTQGTSRITVDYNGTTTLSKNTSSTSNSTGGIVLNGGIGITNTTNAVSSTNGGSFTTAGGMAISQDLYIGGNLFVTGSVPGSLTVSSPTSNTFNLINVSSSVSINTKLLTADAGERMFSGVFLVTPSVSNSTCTFEFTLPGVVSNFSNSYDITGSIQGNHDTSNFYSIENVVFYAVTGGSTRAKVKFTSGSISQHILQFNLRYTIV